MTEEVRETRDESTVHVAYCVDVQGGGAVQFYDMLAVSVASMKDSREDGGRIDCHVMYGNFELRQMERLRAMEDEGFRILPRKIEDRDLAYWQQFTRHDPKCGTARTWGGIVFARMWLPLMLPSVDRCVYLDADTMVRAPISELARIDLGEGNLLGMNMGSVPEFGYNSGVMVMDLAAMRREERMYQRLDRFLREDGAAGYHCPDQTAINRFFAGKICPIGREWNFPPTPGANDPKMGEAKIWHWYNGTRKPYRLKADDAGVSLVEWNLMLETA